MFGLGEDWAMAKITVLIAAYNCGKHIGKCLRSVLAQRMPKKDVEIVVVDDASTDNTAAVLAEYAKSIRVLSNRTNRGLAHSLNRGLRAAKGEYIMRVDGDDYIAGGLLRATLAIAKKKGSDCVYTDRYEVDAKSKKKRLVKVGSGNIFGMVGCGMLFRRDVFRALGGYDNLLFEEYDFMLRFAKKGMRWDYLQKPLYYYIKHGSNMTAKKGYWEKGWGQLLRKWGRPELAKWVGIQARESGSSPFRL